MEMKNSINIALCGRKYTGKDYYANVLEKEYGFKIFSFSDILKR